MRYLWCGLAVCLALTSGLHAADKKTKKSNNANQYKLDDEVEVNFLGEWRRGHIISFDKTFRQIEVEFEYDPFAKPNADDGFPDDAKGPVDPTKTKTWKFQVSDVRRVQAKKGKVDAAKSGKSKTAKPKPKGEIVEWTDKTGKFTVKARFVSLEDDKLTLEKADGKPVTMAISKLNDVGQKRAKKLAEEFAENPFETEEDSSSDEKEGSEGESPANDRPKHGDWSGVQTLRVDHSGDWTLTPDPAKPVGEATKKSIALHANKSQDAFFERVESVAFSPQSLKAAVFIGDHHPGRATVLGVQRVDLATGKADPLVALDKPLKPVDISPSGALVAAISDFHIRRGGGTAQGNVSIYRWEGKSLERVKTWFTFSPTDFFKNDPDTAFFIDEDHLVTISFPHRMVMWDISSGKAVYEATLTGAGKPALSANHKYIACALKEGVCVYDALTGDQVGKLPGGNPGVVQAMSFRPDGLQLATLTNQRLMVFDLAKGEIERDIYFSKAITAGTIDWLQEGYVLCGGQHLIDLERRVVLWQYSQQGQFKDDANGVVGDSYWYLLDANDRSARALFRTKLPHNAAMQMASQLKSDELLSIKPGATIAISWSVQGQQNEQQAAYQAMVKQLSDIGMQYAEKSRLVLQVSTEVGKTTEIAYRGFGFSRGAAETARVTEQISRVRFVEDGNVVWEAVAVSGAPGMLQMKQGETIQQALAPYQQPNLAFFSQVKLPSYVARPHPSGAYGKSELTPQGIVDSPLK